MTAPLATDAAATSAGAGVRPRHVLSAVASGASAGWLAQGAVALSLMLIIGLAGSPIPPAGLDSLEAAIASALGGILCGLFYVSVIGWLPRRLLVRSAVFGLIGAPIAAGVHASAYGVPATGSIDHAIPWILASAAGTCLATPVTLRGVLLAAVRSIASLAVLPVLKSLLLLAIVLIGPVSYLGTVAEVVAVAPLGMLVLVVVIAALTVGAWTLGVRPADRRPAWLAPYGWTLAAVAALTGSAMLVSALVR